ncbi:hypothetical protein BDK51DRAFT_22387, partial [Blyttiomyces helicus]
VLTLPVQPLRINAHSGSDDFPLEDVLIFFEGAAAIEASLPSSLPPISHETHRGRMLHSPWVALRVADARPEVRFTLDISHWNVVAERMIDVETLRPILEKTLHIHARIGTTQASQVADPRSDSVKEFETYHRACWETVWQAHKTSGKMKWTSLTPEYGPVEDLYMPQSYIESEGKHRAERPVDDIIFDEAVRLREVFELHGTASFS